MTHRIFSRVIASGAALGLWLAAVSARAVTFDFRTGNATVVSGGTLTQSGPNFIGTHIPIDYLEVAGSANGTDGVYDVNGPIAILNSNTGQPTGNTAGSLDFATNGTLTLVGSVPGLGLKAIIPLIVSGTFAHFSVFSTNLLAATGPDTKADALLNAVGASGSKPFQFTSSIITENAISSTPSRVASTDLFNTSTATPAVPEPGTLLLLGSGLVGVVVAARRKPTRAS